MSRFKSSLADLMALLLSLLLAVVIWVNAQQGEDPLLRRAVQLPVQFIGAPENVRIIEPSNLNNVVVVVVYEGPASVVDTLTAADFSATVDLSQTPYGQQQLATVEVRAASDQITFDPPAPDQISVHLEPLVSKEIPVTLDLRGSVPRGYTAGETLLEPASITVRGIESDVNPLALARATVFLSNEDTQTKVVSPQPVFYDQQGRIAGVSSLELSHNQVTVTVPIEESADFANRVISVNIVGEPAPGYRVLNTSVNPSSVLLTGRPSLLEQPFRVQTEPIDVIGLTETFSTRVSLALPPGITLDEVQEIVATVEIEPLSSTKIFNRPIEVLGLAADREALVQPETARVVLFGPLPVLDAMPEQEVEVTVDVFGLNLGTYELEPTVSIPNRGLEIRSVQPALITVVITRPTPTAPLTDTADLESTAVPSLQSAGVEAKPPVNTFTLENPLPAGRVALTPHRELGNAAVLFNIWQCTPISGTIAAYESKSLSCPRRAPQCGQIHPL